MNKLAISLIAITSLLSGCVVYDPYRDGGGRHGERGGPPPHRADHDRDGVPDNQDRRPSDPNRY
jgi:hypothetical protein